MAGLRLKVVGAALAAILAAGGSLFLFKGAEAQNANPAVAAGLAVVNDNCAACHGPGGQGGDRAPSLVGNQKLRTATDAEVTGIVRNGTTGGMPGFDGQLTPAELTQVVAYLRDRNPSAVSTGSADQIAAGEKYFFGEGGCATCHMVRGVGNTNGPDLSTVALRYQPAKLDAILTDPTSQQGTESMPGCPGWAFCSDVRWSVVNVVLANGQTLRGFPRGQAEHDLQLQTFDGKFHMLHEGDYKSVTREEKSYMPAFSGSATQKRDVLAYLSSLSVVPLGPAPAGQKPAPAVPYTNNPNDWPTYDGQPSGNRYSALSQINTGNVARLQAKWSFSPGGESLQTTPIVQDGIMYVTGAQRICALDAVTGRTIWCSARSIGNTPPVPAPAAAARAGGGGGGGGGGGRGGAANQDPNANRAVQGLPAETGRPNRGPAISGDRIFFVSDDAYLVCLNRVTGAVMWIQPLADPKYPGRYYNTHAPLVVGTKIVSGVSGGDGPVRGFLVAFDIATGQQAWRVWTIPLPGEPGSETWAPENLPLGGGATWSTGSYDPVLKTIYWATGNPYPPVDRTSVRPGANLYSESVIAVDPDTGKVKWSYQFSPHDIHDWDATQPLVLADTMYNGQPRKLLMSAQRNGLFYVVDRVTGKFLFGSPFVKATWTSGFTPDGVPITTENNEISGTAGKLTCPAVRGATNWYAQAFNPATRLFYVMAAEDCNDYSRGYTSPRDPKNPGYRFLRALNIETGKVVWEKPMVGPNEANYGGVLSTAGGLVFQGETGGRFAAVDAKTGKTLWTYPFNEFPRAAAMTYMVGGKQYVGMVMGGNLTTFGLP